MIQASCRPKITGQVHGCSRVLPTTGNGQWRFSQPTPYYDSGINIINVLEGYSLWQVLTQRLMNSIQEFDGTDSEATIPWLDHIKAVARKTGFDPIEIGTSKLKVWLSVM